MKKKDENYRRNYERAVLNVDAETGTRHDKVGGRYERPTYLGEHYG